MMKRKLLGDYLLEKGIITQAQLDEAIDEQKRTHRKIGDILIRKGHVKEEDVAAALAEQLGFPFVDLATRPVKTDAALAISAETAVRFQAIPIDREGDELTVAMANPLDVAAIDEISRLVPGARVSPVLATGSAIKHAIEKQYGITEGDHIYTPAAMPAPATGARLPKAESEEAMRLLQEAAQAPVVKIVNSLIEDAVKTGASDIHIEPQEEHFFVRFRIDGILHDVPPPPREFQLPVISRIKIMADMDIAQNRLPQDGRIETKALAKEIDLRIATFPTIHGEHIAMRILDKSRGIVQLEELGFQAGTLAAFKEIIYKPYGIILVTGPTGSGKSTTLYTVLNTINDLKKNIVTIEDPVEYTIPRVQQSQVNVKAGLTFDVGLRSLVRLDPDIIMIGEIRDRETAEIAIHSSLTGHLVFSTLHTNDAPAAASRLVDIGVEPYLVSSSLVGVVAQRLVRKLCPQCRKETAPSAEEAAIITKALGRKGRQVPKGFTFFKEVGCPACFNTGYKGRIGIYELLIPDNHIRELIMQKSPSHDIRETAVKNGMQTLREDGFEKVLAGITSLAEVLAVTEDV